MATGDWFLAETAVVTPGQPQYASVSADIATILDRRWDQGGDWWTTPDRRLIKGAPFSTLECVNYLLDLGVSPESEILTPPTDLIFESWQDDGRFRLYPNGAMLPCHTAYAARTLCKAGYVDDPRVATTLRQLLDSRWTDDGWRCNKFSYGRGPETNSSNPHPTLQALEAFRFSDHLNTNPALDRSVEFLLQHWESRTPLGPCHYGIGSRFMQVEYPFRTYGLFYWVHTLSFYDAAKRDPRFLEAWGALQSKAPDGHIIVERAAPRLTGLHLSAKGQANPIADARMQEIRANLSQ